IYRVSAGSFSKDVTRMTEKEKDLFAAIEAKDFEKAAELIKSGADVNSHDAGGMSVLAAAAYRGSADLVQLCIENGANVNDKEHNQGYTPLMFAALAGQHECVSIINNHVSIDEIERFLSPQVGSAPEEVYPYHLSRFIHKMCSWHQ
ncbi:ankyrin repeat protein, partial [Teladorsagia circumcincta]